MRSPLRSPAQVEGTQGFLPQPEKDLERPSSTRLEATALRSARTRKMREAGGNHATLQHHLGREEGMRAAAVIGRGDTVVARVPGRGWRVCARRKDGSRCDNQRDQ